jgi:hypothetical protein
MQPLARKAILDLLKWNVIGSIYRTAEKTAPIDHNDQVRTEKSVDYDETETF